MSSLERLWEDFDGAGSFDLTTTRRLLELAVAVKRDIAACVECSGSPSPWGKFCGCHVRSGKALDNLEEE